MRQVWHAYLEIRRALSCRVGRAREKEAPRDGRAFHSHGGEFPDWLDLALAQQALRRTGSQGGHRTRIVRPSLITGAARE
jgi:hypothetical protein